MTEPGDVLLDRAQLERAFTALGERLVRRGVVADVFVVGGAAMALAYDATRVTRDVDSLFVPHGIVLEEARNVAKDLGMPPRWLNEQASVYISGKDDPGKRRVFDHPGLRVTAASPRHIFAMKAFAARTRDIDDLRLLANIIGMDSSATAGPPLPPWVGGTTCTRRAVLRRRSSLILCRSRSRSEDSFRFAATCLRRPAIAVEMADLRHLPGRAPQDVRRDNHTLNHASGA